MSDQERNFRNQYYGKVGFRTVEEKKSIESLLKEQPMKHEKLAQFCLHFGLPAMYRLYVWKILLGVLPINQACQDFVWFHRQEQVKELERAAILLCPSCIDGPQELKVLVMRLIEQGNLPLKRDHLGLDASHQHFLAIVRTVSSLVTSETDLFWISTRFYQHITTGLGPLDQFPEYTMQCLMKEDKNHKLYEHLCKHHAFRSLPLHRWFHQCFASVLPETAVERIWDRVISGSSHVLVFVAVAIFLVLRRPLLAMQSAEDIASYLRRIPEDCGDRIVNEGLNLFQENGRIWPLKEGSPLTLSGGDHSRGPVRQLTDSGRHLTGKQLIGAPNTTGLTPLRASLASSSSSSSGFGKVGAAGYNIGRKSPNTTSKDS